MKVVMLKDGKTVEVNDGYGLRLVEQGKANPAPPKVEQPKAVKPKEAPKKEAPQKSREEKPNAKKEKDLRK